MSYVHTGRDEPTFPIEDIDESYALMCRYVLLFLRAELEADEASRELLESSSHEWIGFRGNVRSR